MNLNTIVKTAMFASILFGAVCQADTSSGGMATGKRQHKPITITKPLDKATPVLAASASSSAKTESFENGRSTYRLCPDGTMIHPGEKCPEKSAKR